MSNDGALTAKDIPVIPSIGGKNNVQDALGVSAGGGVQTVVAGTNITVDDTDPNNPIISSSGGGDVTSVNTQTGDVVLAAADVGADASGAAATAQTNAEAYTDSSIATEVTNRNAAIVSERSAAATLTNHSIDASQLTGSVALARLPTGTASTNVPTGGTITGAGPIGDAAHTPVLTYNAAGQLTAVTNTAIVIAESQVTNLTADLAALQTQASLVADQQQAQLDAALGYYIGQGCVYSPNATPTKFDSTSGTALLGLVEAQCGAQTAFTVTITSLASGLSAGQAVCVKLEIAPGGGTVFNSGAASATPAWPTTTAGNALAGRLWVPFGATQVDTALTSSNGNAKYLGGPVVRPGVLSPTGWCYDQNTWTFVNSSTTAAGVLTSVSTTIATSLFNKTAHGLVAGDTIFLSGISTTTGVSNNTLYFVSATGLTANVFRVAALPGGTAITFGGTTDAAVTVFSVNGVITYKVAGLDATGWLVPGTKVSWNDATNTPGYGVIAAVTFSTDTYVTLIAQSDYVMANHAIVYPRYSTIEAPGGFPTAFDWTPTTNGYTPAGTLVYRWSTTQRKMHASVYQSGSGASAVATHTISAPVVAAGPGTQVWQSQGQMIDNAAAAVGLLSIAHTAWNINFGPASSLTFANTTGANNKPPTTTLEYEF